MYVHIVTLSPPYFLEETRERGATDAAVDGRGRDGNGDKNESRNPIYILRQCRTLLLTPAVAVLGSGQRETNTAGKYKHMLCEILSANGRSARKSAWPVHPSSFSLIVTKFKL